MIKNIKGENISVCSLFCFDFQVKSCKNNSNKSNNQKFLIEIYINLCYNNIKTIVEAVSAV